MHPSRLDALLSRRYVRHIVRHFPCFDMERLDQVDPDRQEPKLISAHNERKIQLKDRK